LVEVTQSKTSFKKNKKAVVLLHDAKNSNDPILGRVSEGFDNSRGVAQSNAN